jgi:hypothetical protein
LPSFLPKQESLALGFTGAHGFSVEPVFAIAHEMEYSAETGMAAFPPDGTSGLAWKYGYVSSSLR